MKNRSVEELETLPKGIIRTKAYVFKGNMRNTSESCTEHTIMGFSKHPGLILNRFELF